MNTIKKKKKYTDDQLQTAISAVKEGRMGISEASGKYNIPKATLHDKVNQKYPEGATPGAHTVLTKIEEQQLVKWILYLSNVGFPITKHNLINSVKNLVENLDRHNPFKNGKPGRHWYEGFMARHPELSIRVSQNLTAPRANITEQSIRAWFARIDSYLEKENLKEVLTDPRRIFNCDESAFYLSPKENSVIVQKGSNRVYSKTANDEKECLTVLMTVSADGNIQPPLVLFPYKRTPASIILNMPPKWGIGRSESGWMTGETFYEYVTNVFYPWLIENDINFPIILYMDGHSSHINLPLSEFCSEKKIILIALLPNSTHRLQPLDVAVFRPLKHHWKEHRKSQHTKLKREDFSKALDQCIKNAALNGAIINGFRTCGLYPFDPNSIDYNKLIQIIEDDKTEATEQPKKTTRATVSFLTEVEMRIPENHLEEFRMSGDTWLGDPKNHGLFYFWKKVNDDCLQVISDHEETLNANINVLNNCSTDWLTSSEVLNLEVQPDGSLALDNQLPCLTENTTCKIPNPSKSSTAMEYEDNNKLSHVITPETQHNSPLKAIEIENRSILTEITDLNESFALDTELTCPLENTRELTNPAQSLTALKEVNLIPERHFEYNNQPNDVLTPEPQPNTPSKPIQIEIIENRSILNEITNFKSTLALETQSSSLLQNTCEVANPAQYLTAIKEDNLVSEKLLKEVQSTDAKTSESQHMTPESQHMTPVKAIQLESGSVLTPLKTVTYEDIVALRSKTYSTPGKLQQNSKENCASSCSKPHIPTPLKHIGTPFKKALFWPGILKKDNTQKIKKRVIPTVATSEEFINYQKKMDNEKREKERMKEEKKKNKLINPPKKRKITKNNDSIISDPVEQSTSVTNKRKVGDYVVVNYEGEFFPGVITEFRNSETLVKTMTMSGLNWKWPNKDDIVGYQDEEIVRNIKCPNQVNKRGVFSVPEIEELRNNNNS